MKRRFWWWMALAIGCPKGESGDSVESPVVDTTAGESGESPPDSSSGDSVETGFPEDTTPPVLVDVAADAWLTVHSTTEEFGEPVALGDVTGDGVDDVCFTTLYSEPDPCYGFRSPIPSGIYDSDEADFVLSASLDFRSIGTPGDVNGDGIHDVVMGGSVFFGPVDDVENTTTSDVQIVYNSDIYMANERQASPGDANGDGLDDVLMDFWEWPLDPKDGGVSLVVVYTELEPGEVAMRDYFGSYDLGERETESGMVTYGFLGDTNGDGFDDSYFQVPYERTAMVFLGPVGIVFNRPDTIVDLSTWPTAAGDVNGDGYEDLATVGPGGCFEGDVCVGILFGPLAEEGDIDGADVRFFLEGSEAADRVSDIDNVGDSNGDGRSDIMIMLWEGSSHASTAYLFESPLESTVTNVDADLITTTYLDPGVADGPADLDGDGLVDLLLGDGDAYGYVLLGGTW